MVDIERIRWEDKDALTTGNHTLSFEFNYDGGGIGKGGVGILSVDGKKVARKTIKFSIPFILQWDETFDVGEDTGTSVDDADYEVPFSFTGKLNKLTVKLGSQHLTAAEQKEISVNSRRNNRMSE